MSANLTSSPVAAERAQQSGARLKDQAAELQRANEDLEELVHIVSHDLRAPLRAMHGFGEALLEDHGNAMDPSARDFARRIVEAARHMDNVARDLVAYVRLGQAPLRTEKVEVQSAVFSAVGRLPADCRRCVVSTAQGEVLGDAELLAQVITNLLDNAIRFVAKDTRPLVEVRARRNTDSVRICVSDNGIGINPRHHESIFEPFRRLHGTDDYPGTGIGLAIVRRAVQLMDGNVGLESEPGRGSTFWVELPSA